MAYSGPGCCGGTRTRSVTLHLLLATMKPLEFRHELMLYLFGYALI